MFSNVLWACSKAGKAIYKGIRAYCGARPSGDYQTLDDADQDLTDIVITDPLNGMKSSSSTSQMHAGLSSTQTSSSMLLEEDDEEKKNANSDIINSKAFSARQESVSDEPVSNLGTYPKQTSPSQAKDYSERDWYKLACLKKDELITYLTENWKEIGLSFLKNSTRNILLVASILLSTRPYWKESIAAFNNAFNILFYTGVIDTLIGVAALRGECTDAYLHFSEAYFLLGVFFKEFGSFFGLDEFTGREITTALLTVLHFFDPDLKVNTNPGGSFQSQVASAEVDDTPPGEDEWVRSKNLVRAILRLAELGVYTIKSGMAWLRAFALTGYSFTTTGIAALCTALTNLFSTVGLNIHNREKDILTTNNNWFYRLISTEKFLQHAVLSSLLSLYSTVADVYFFRGDEDFDLFANVENVGLTIGFSVIVGIISAELRRLLQNETAGLEANNFKMKLNPNRQNRRSDMMRMESMALEKETFYGEDTEKENGCWACLDRTFGWLWTKYKPSTVVASASGALKIKYE